MVQTSWADGPMIGYDCETTSPLPREARIVTAAIVLEIPGQERQTFSWLANPDCEIDLKATAVHGISTEHAQTHGDNAKTVITDILDVMAGIRRTYGPIPMVCVNACFDLTILHCEAKRLDISARGFLPKFPVIDTLILDRTFDKYRRGRRTLTATCANYGIVIRGAHTADGDVIASLDLARAMADKFAGLRNASLGSLQVLQRVEADRRADEFEEYRRMDGVEKDFTVDRGWPILDGA